MLSSSLLPSAPAAARPTCGGLQRQARLPRAWGRRDHPQRRGSSVTCRSIRARWCLDARFGCKGEATKLLQEWVVTVGAAAGLLEMGQVHLSSGAVGCPESRLELEVTVDTVADWEAFLERVPAQEHRAWSQRIQSMVVDGSPVWQLYRVVPLALEQQQGPSSGASSSSRSSGRFSSTRQLGDLAPAQGSSGSSLFLPSDVSSLDALLQAEARQSQVSRQPGGSLWTTGLNQAAAADAGDAAAPAADADGGDDADDGGEVVLDWKGDPIKFRKGDRLPRFL